jgi:hypothetical protein
MRTAVCSAWRRSMHAEEGNLPLALEFHERGGRIHGFPYGHLLNYLLERNPDADAQPDAPADRFSLCFPPIMSPGVGGSRPSPRSCATGAWPPCTPPMPVTTGFPARRPPRPKGLPMKTLSRSPSFAHHRTLLPTLSRCGTAVL